MLMLHSDSTNIQEDALRLLPMPEPRGPFHRPIPHSDLVRGLRLAALARGYVVTRQQFGVNRTGHRLFGVLDLLPPPSVAATRSEDHGLSIGFRNSTDESLGIRMVAGVRVFVCDNLALSGDFIALKRRNTTRLDLEEALKEGFDRYLLYANSLDRQIAALQRATLTSEEAKAKIVDLFTTRILPMRLFRPVVRNYFNPNESMTDCQPATRWGLLNACTRALKLMAPRRAFEANVALGHAFGLSHQ